MKAQQTESGLVLISIQKASDALGITKHAIYYRLKKNIDNITEYCYVVFNGDVSSAQKWTKELSEKDDLEKRYFFEKSYIDGLESKDVVTKEDEEEFSDIYFKIVELIEDRLEAEHKSIATEQQKWANMKLVDTELCGEIFSRYKERYGEELGNGDKALIRSSIKGYRFSFSRLIKISILEMRDILNDLENQA